MFPPFPVQPAHQINLAVIEMLQNGSAELLQLTRESQERQGHGVMIGTLICRKGVEAAATAEPAPLPAAENFPEAGLNAAASIPADCTVLIAVSGISLQLKLNPALFPFSTTIVPPIVSPELIEKALLPNDLHIHNLTDRINSPLISASEKETLKAERTKLTTESLERVFNLYNFTRFDGKQISLSQIISEHNNNLPSTGTGDCCAPKLLSYAFSHNLVPLSMDEVFFGRSTKSKENGKSYGPCDERCGYILPSILGLEILYQDKDIVIVNKQSGLLSVPGRTPDKQDCIVSRLKALFPDCIQQPSVHRLDMETSGILILALNAQAHKELNRQFAEGLVQKKYSALLDGILEKASGKLAPKRGEKSGRIELKFRLDVDNRPHQIYDEEFGKPGITEWHNLGLVNYKLPDGSLKKVTKIQFEPHTGRTHQLRLHSSDVHGFGLPIIGDTLYGTCLPGQRLMLHAEEIEFTHPSSGEKMHFYCKADW